MYLLSSISIFVPVFSVSSFAFSVTSLVLSYFISLFSSSSVPPHYFLHLPPFLPSLSSFVFFPPPLIRLSLSSSEAALKPTFQVAFDYFLFPFLVSISRFPVSAAILSFSASPQFLDLVYLSLSISFLHPTVQLSSCPLPPLVKPPKFNLFLSPSLPPSINPQS